MAFFYTFATAGKCSVCGYETDRVLIRLVEDGEHEQVVCSDCCGDALNQRDTLRAEAERLREGLNEYVCHERSDVCRAYTSGTANECEGCPVRALEGK